MSIYTNAIDLNVCTLKYNLQRKQKFGNVNISLHFIHNILLFDLRIHTRTQ